MKKTAIVLAILISACAGPQPLKIPDRVEIPVYSCPAPPEVAKPDIQPINPNASPAKIIGELLKQRNLYKAWGEQLNTILDAYKPSFRQGLPESSLQGGKATQ